MVGWCACGPELVVWKLSCGSLERLELLSNQLFGLQVGYLYKGLGSVGVAREGQD
jgi:hypothetical protein